VGGVLTSLPNEASGNDVKDLLVNKAQFTLPRVCWYIPVLDGH